MVHFTTVGIIWIIINVVLQILPVQYTIYTLYFSCIFPSVMCASLAGKTGINMCIITEAILSLRIMFICLKKNRHLYMNRGICYIVCFGLWGLIITLIGPLLFYKLNDAYRDIKHLSKPVEFVLNTSSISKIILLGMHILTVVLLYQLKYEIDIKKLFRFIIFENIIVIIFGFWQYANVKVGVPYPSSIIYSNIGFSVWNAKRMRSTFNEASFLSGFLIPHLVGDLIFDNKFYNILFILNAICLVFSFSTAGLISFVFGIILVLILKKPTLKFWTKSIMLTASGIIFMVLSGQWEKIYASISDKLISYLNIEGQIAYIWNAASGDVRSLWDKTALNVFLDTKFLGGGLAVARGSSFLTTMLATTGIIGVSSLTLFFGWYIKKNYRNLKEDKISFFVFIYCVMNLSVKIIAMPDINDLTMWLMIFFIISHEKAQRLGSAILKKV